MVGIVIVSHSQKVAEGIKEIAMQMAKAGQTVSAAGGSPEGGIGTDPVRIADAVAAADSGEGVAVLVDLGSAILSAEMALEMLEDKAVRAQIVDAPVLEGAVAAVVEASLGSPLEKVVQTAESSREMRKRS